MGNNLQIFIDLGSAPAHRMDVEAKIKELGGWAKIRESFWYVDSTYSATQARDHIIPAAKIDDVIFVVNASSGQAAWRGIGSETGEYVKKKWASQG